MSEEITPDVPAKRKILNALGWVLFVGALLGILFGMFCAGGYCALKDYSWRHRLEKWERKVERFFNPK